jgi:predicted nucleic acid-binding protein
VSRFVLDNTVTMAWCFIDEATEFTETLLDRLSNSTDSAIVPALWLYEVVNVTGMAVRKGRITEEKSRAFLESLADLPIEIEDPTRTQMFVSVRALVGQYNLTAVRHKLPLAALDNALARAARDVGVSIMQL